jgi:hypothetical protein
VDIIILSVNLAFSGEESRGKPLTALMTGIISSSRSCYLSVARAGADHLPILLNRNGVHQFYSVVYNVLRSRYIHTHVPMNWNHLVDQCRLSERPRFDSTYLPVQWCIRAAANQLGMMPRPDEPGSTVECTISVRCVGSRFNQRNHAHVFFAMIFSSCARQTCLHYGVLDSGKCCAPA